MAKRTRKRNQHPGPPGKYPGAPASDHGQEATLQSQREKPYPTTDPAPIPPEAFPGGRPATETHRAEDPPEAKKTGDYTPTFEAVPVVRTPTPPSQSMVTAAETAPTGSRQEWTAVARDLRHNRHASDQNNAYVAAARERFPDIDPDEDHRITRNEASGVDHNAEYEEYTTPTSPRDYARRNATYATDTDTPVAPDGYTPVGVKGVYAHYKGNKVYVAHPGLAAPEMQDAIARNGGMVHPHDLHEGFSDASVHVVGPTATMSAHPGVIGEIQAHTVLEPGVSARDRYVRAQRTVTNPPASPPEPTEEERAAGVADRVEKLRTMVAEKYPVTPSPTPKENPLGERQMVTFPGKPLEDDPNHPGYSRFGALPAPRQGPILPADPELVPKAWETPGVKALDHNPFTGIPVAAEHPEMSIPATHEQDRVEATRGPAIAEAAQQQAARNPAQSRWEGPQGPFARGEGERSFEHQGTKFTTEDAVDQPDRDPTLVPNGGPVGARRAGLFNPLAEAGPPPKKVLHVKDPLTIAKAQHAHSDDPSVYATAKVQNQTAVVANERALRDSHVVVNADSRRPLATLGRTDEEAAADEATVETHAAKEEGLDDGDGPNSVPKSNWVEPQPLPESQQGHEIRRGAFIQGAQR